MDHGASSFSLDVRDGLAETTRDLLDASLLMLHLPFFDFCIFVS